MSILGKLLRRKSELDGMTQVEKMSVVETVLAEAETVRTANANNARQLTTRLAGNHKLVLNERPDGSGFFYGQFHDESGASFRVDVMPPRDLWWGDFGHDAAHATDWVVYINGEEAQRAATVDGLSGIAGG